MVQKFHHIRPWVATEKSISVVVKSIKNVSLCMDRMAICVMLCGCSLIPFGRQFIPPGPKSALLPPLSALHSSVTSPLEHNHYNQPNIMKFKAFGLVMAAIFTAQHASAALISTVLGDRGDGYTVVQIVYNNTGDNTGTWTVPGGVTTVELLVVGGGGAGGAGGAFGPSGGSPGGGAGGLYYTTSLGVSGTINLAVGIGAASVGSGNGGTGGNTFFGDIIAYGGQGGITTTNQGGNQGGYSLNNGGSVTAGYLGGTGSGATGGAGATENGKNGGFEPAYGGAGATIPITGSFGVIGADGNPISGFYGDMIGYAGGGSAGYDGELLGATHGEPYGGGSGTEPEGFAGGAGFDTLGGGGGGGRGAASGAGGDGVIYIAYLNPVPEPSAALLGGLGMLALLRRRRNA